MVYAYVYEDADGHQEVWDESLEHLTWQIEHNKLPTNGTFFSELLPKQNPLLGISDKKRKMTPTLNPSAADFANQRLGKPVTVLTGPNNSGKSFFLKNLYSHYGRRAYLLGNNRFYTLHQLPNRLRNTPEQNSQVYDQWLSRFTSGSSFNSEDNVITLEHVLVDLTTKQRDALFALCKDLLGNTFTLELIDKERDLSPRFISMDGQSLAYGSTGTRLLILLLGVCILETYNVLMIDEPELGLSPKLQLIIADLLYDTKRRQGYFPCLDAVFVATHSHLFLDYKNIANNFAVEKKADVISATQLRAVGDLHSVHFNMLGGSLESLFLPSAIVIVEGKYDFKFLGKVVSTTIGDNRKVAVISAKVPATRAELFSCLKRLSATWKRALIRRGCLWSLTRRNQ